jgi:hypothetical protein
MGAIVKNFGASAAVHLHAARFLHFGLGSKASKRKRRMAICLNMLCRQAKNGNSHWTIADGAYTNYYLWIYQIIII